MAVIPIVEAQKDENLGSLREKLREARRSMSEGHAYLGLRKMEIDQELNSLRDSGDDGIVSVSYSQD